MTASHETALCGSPVHFSGNDLLLCSLAKEAPPRFPARLMRQSWTESPVSIHRCAWGEESLDGGDLDNDLLIC
jgi:hypothetical protein